MPPKTKKTKINVDCTDAARLVQLCSAEGYGVCAGRSAQGKIGQEEYRDHHGLFEVCAFAHRSFLPPVAIAYRMSSATQERHQQVHDLGEEGRASDEEGRSGEEGRASGEEGHASGEEGRASGEEGRGSGEEGRASGEEGRGSGEEGRASGEGEEGLRSEERLGASPVHAEGLERFGGRFPPEQLR